MKNAIFLAISTAFVYSKNVDSNLSCLVVDGQVQCSTLLKGKNDYILGNHTEWDSRRH